MLKIFIELIELTVVPRLSQNNFIECASSSKLLESWNKGNFIFILIYLFLIYFFFLLRVQWDFTRYEIVTGKHFLMNPRFPRACSKSTNLVASWNTPGGQEGSPNRNTTRIRHLYFWLYFLFYLTFTSPVFCLLSFVSRLFFHPVIFELTLDTTQTKLVTDPGKDWKNK